MEKIILKYNGDSITTFIGARVCTKRYSKEIACITDKSIKFTDSSSLGISSLFSHKNYLVENVHGSLICPLEFFLKLKPQDKEFVAELKAKYADVKSSNPCAEVKLPQSAREAVRQAEKVNRYAAMYGMGGPISMSARGVIPLRGQLHINIIRDEVSMATHNFDIPSHLLDSIGYFNQATAKKEPKMIEKKLEIEGKNIYTATEEDLLRMITNLEKRVNTLADIQTESAYVNAKIAKIEKAIRKVVKELDSRV